VKVLWLAFSGDSPKLTEVMNGQVPTEVMNGHGHTSYCGCLWCYFQGVHASSLFEKGRGMYFQGYLKAQEQRDDLVPRYRV
jgi:hypothetical protein